MQWVQGGGGSSGDGGVDAACLLFRTEAEYSSELSLVGETRERHGLTINNSPNIKLDDSENTGMLPEIRFLRKLEVRYVYLL